MAGGAAAQAAALISFAMGQAQALAGSSDARIKSAVNSLNSVPELREARFVSTMDPITVYKELSSGELQDALISIDMQPDLEGTAPVQGSADDVWGRYASTSTEVMDRLTEIFSDFFQTYFPPDTYVAAAEDWIENVLTTGGSGINKAVEAQLWGRNRSRALADAARAQEELATAWASRRFPMPPGAYMHASLLIDTKTQEAVAEAARTQAVESFKTEIENVRIAVERAVQLRSLAMESAGAYIREMALTYQTGSAVTSAMLDAQVKTSSALTDYYKAQLEGREFQYKAALGNFNANWEREKINHKDIDVDRQYKFADLTMEAAKMAATMGAAALNSVHGQASVSGADSTITNIEG